MPQLFCGRGESSGVGYHNYVDTIAPSRRVLAARKSGSVVDDAEYCKKLKYHHLDSMHTFVPIDIKQ